MSLLSVPGHTVHTRERGIGERGKRGRGKRERGKREKGNRNIIIAGFK